MRILPLVVLFFTSNVFSCEYFDQFKDELSRLDSVNEYSKSLSQNKNFTNGITKSEFDRVIDKIENMYRPVFRLKGKQLKIRRNWRSNELNAFALKEADLDTITIHGGFARHSENTSEGFALMVCHEIGHHIGGAPLYTELNSAYSSEGQADYFATVKCFREYVARDDNSSIVQFMNIPKAVVNKCNKVYKNNEESAICQRAIQAGLDLSGMLASFRQVKRPSINITDKSRVAVTFNNHNSPQCRLDTYAAGALCDKSIDLEVSDYNTHDGVCHPRNKDKVGNRPACWFKN